jgi:hypothetical protein
VHHHPLAIRELRRILLEHAAEVRKNQSLVNSDQSSVKAEEASPRAEALPRVLRVRLFCFD